MMPAPALNPRRQPVPGRFKQTASRPSAEKLKLGLGELQKEKVKD